MIIWSRWGIVVLLFIGLGIGLGFAIAGILGLIAPSGPRNGVFVGIGFMLSAVGLYFFNKHVVDKHLDKPRAAVVYEKLPEPVRLENGAVQTHRAIAVTHPETGQQLVTKPTSSFFFVPVRYWPFVLGGLGALVFLINLVALIVSGG